MKVKEEIHKIVTETIEDKVKNNICKIEKDRHFTAMKKKQTNKHDEVITKLFSDTLKIDNNVFADRIISGSRLGKKEGNNRGPRLMKVVLGKQSTEKKIIRASSNGEEGIRKIKIFKDMTQVDRDKRKAILSQNNTPNLSLRFKDSIHPNISPISNMNYSHIRFFK